MYGEDELDVALIQPPLFKPIFPEDQNPVFNQYLSAVTGRSALKNDLGTEPNHGLLQLASILITAGIKQMCSISMFWTSRSGRDGRLSARTTSVT
jgi:hypothetical protein